MEEIGDIKTSRKNLISVSTWTLLLFLYSDKIAEISLGFVKFNKDFQLFEWRSLLILLVINVYVLWRYVQSEMKDSERLRGVNDKKYYAYGLLSTINKNKITEITVEEYGSWKTIYEKGKSKWPWIEGISFKFQNGDVSVIDWNGVDDAILGNIFCDDMMHWKVVTSKKGGKTWIWIWRTYEDDIQETYEESKIPEDSLSLKARALESGNKNEIRKSYTKTSKRLTRLSLTVRADLSFLDKARWLLFDIRMNKNYTDFELPKILGIFALVALIVQWSPIFNTLNNIANGIRHLLS